MHHRRMNPRATTEDPMKTNALTSIRLPWFVKRRALRAGFWGAVLCVWALSLSGCPIEDGSSDPLPDWPSDILIEPSTVSMSYDQEDVAALESGLRTQEQALVGDPATLLKPLRDGLLLGNTLLQPGLRLLHGIARNNEPTRVSQDHYRWELTDKGAFITLEIRRDDANDNQWNYRLLIQPVENPDAAEQPVMTGFFRPGPRTEGGRQTGAGLLRYHYNAFAALPDSDVIARGQGAVGFRVERDGTRKLQVLFEDFRARPSNEPFNARYRYELAPEKHGRFAFTLVADLIRQASGPELLVGAVAWNSDSSARGRAFLRGNYPQDIVVDECWGTDKRQTWIQWDPGQIAESDGNESDCAPGLPEEIELPSTRPVNPGEDPTIPE